MPLDLGERPGHADIGICQVRPKHKHAGERGEADRERNRVISKRGAPSRREEKYHVVRRELPAQAYGGSTQISVWERDACYDGLRFQRVLRGRNLVDTLQSLEISCP